MVPLLRYKMNLARFGSLDDGVVQYFIVMQNVFYDSDTSKMAMDTIQETYDLKGSTVARSASPLKVRRRKTRLDAKPD